MQKFVNSNVEEEKKWKKTKEEIQAINKDYETNK